MTLSSLAYPSTSRATAWAVPTRAALLMLTALALVLRFWGFGWIPSDPFYDAAVRSMGLSWSNFFYGAFDPGGTLSIDKPPIDLWLQVASTKLFGFSSTSVRLPEAVAGAVAVPLLYDLVRRRCGHIAGLSAAAALAVLPAAVLTSRSDTMDTLCGTVLIAAAWAIVALKPGRGVLVAAALAGLAFEIKLFQAAVAFPALIVLAWYELEADRRRWLIRAGLVFVAVAALWPVAASLVPGAHPWALGATDGKVWNVILVYNGLYRLGAATGPAAPTGPSPWRLFTSGYMELVGFYLLVTFAAALVASRGRLSRNPLVLGVTVWIACGFVLFSVQGWVRFRYFEAFTPALAAGLGIAVARVARERALVTAVLLAAALAWPLTTSLQVVRTGRYDSQTLGAMAPSLVDRLSPYARTGRLAVSSAVLAAPLIAHDGKPMTILTSWKGQPFTTDRDLRAKVAHGDVRFALLDPTKTAPSVQWALTHGQDMTSEVGVGVGPGLRFVRLGP